MRGKADLLLMAGRSTNVSREGRREGATARKEREKGKVEEEGGEVGKEKRHVSEWR